MVVRNFTTKIDVNKTVMEIECLLVRFGAHGVYKEYVGSSLSSITFFLVKDGQKIPFKLPVSIEKARTVITLAVKERKLPKKYMNEPLRSEQGERVAWRIIKDWIDSQLSLLEMQFADPIEILLPYAYDVVHDKTLYQKFVENKERFISLENKSGEP